MQQKRSCKMLRFPLWLSKAVSCIPAVANLLLSMSIQVALLLKAYIVLFCRWVSRDNVTA